MLIGRVDRFWRRDLLLVGLALPVLAASGSIARAAEPTSLADLLATGLNRDASGALASIFDLEPSLASEVLLPATRADALPDGYTPADLVSTAARGLPSNGSQLIRAVVLQDTRALIGAAQDAAHELYVGSGFRAQSYQERVFAAQTARWGDEDTANRYSARPGHSQHQLGTTIDFTSEFRGFRGSPAAYWLQDNAHTFGFVLPYTVSATSLTGYIDEPWHARWVGRSLASTLQNAGYQTWSTMSADDAVNWVHARIP